MTKYGFLCSILAHASLVVASIFSISFERADGILGKALALFLGALTVLSISYFLVKPASFFFMKSSAEISLKINFIVKSKFFLSVFSWTYLVWWFLSWLILNHDWSRLFSTYWFMTGVTSTIFLSDFLFFKDAREK